MAEFCKQFNEQTKNYEKDVPVPVVLSGTALIIDAIYLVWMMMCDNDHNGQWMDSGDV